MRRGGGFRLNDEIRIRQVRLVDPDGQMVGVVPTEEALAMARENDLDLVEVSPNADPPVCKVLDYGKFKYEQKKREHEARKRQRGGDFKEIRFRPKTDTHDREIKLDRARRFLAEGHRVQITLMFRGREMQHASTLGREMLGKIAKELEDIAKIERHVSREGRRAFMSLMPKPGVKQADKSTEKKTEKESERKSRRKSERKKAKAESAGEPPAPSEAESEAGAADPA